MIKVVTLKYITTRVVKISTKFKGNSHYIDLENKIKKPKIKEWKKINIKYKILNDRIYVPIRGKYFSSRFLL